MEQLEGELYSKKPETIIVISPHGNLMSEAFTINHSPTLKGNFEDFGDLETSLEFKNDLGLAYQIREFAETKVPLILTTEESLDHGALVPLFYLTQHLKDIAVIPMGYSMLNRQTHFELGKYIREVLNKTSKRVALIASGDLSHRLTNDAPAGYSQEGQKFDKKIVELIKNKKFGEIINLDEKLVEEAGECGYRSMLILLGAISEINYQPEVLSYEGPFGVGYLVANFII